MDRGFPGDGYRRACSQLRPSARAVQEVMEMPEDERKKEILLTPKALDIRRRMDEHMRRRRECLCRGISREELETMEDGLEKIVDNMKQ